MLNPALLVAVCVLLGVLPFVAGLVEWALKRDDKPLHIDSDYVRETRFFGSAFRRKLLPALGDMTGQGAEGPHRVGNEPVFLYDRVEVAREEHRLQGILVSLGDAIFHARARIGKSYVAGDARVGERVEIASLACDGNVELKGACRINRWLDADGDIHAGADCNLGQSTSTARTLELREGCQFQRLWGLPIVVTCAMPSPPQVLPGSIENTVTRSAKRLSLPAGLRMDTDVVSETDVLIGAGAVINGSIKAHGSVYLQEGASVNGGIFSRKDVFIGPDSAVQGHVFAEGHITLGSNVQVGEIDAFKSVFAARRVKISSGTRIFGWTCAGEGGSVL